MENINECTLSDSMSSVLYETVPCIIPKKSKPLTPSIEETPTLDTDFVGINRINDHEWMLRKILELKKGTSMTAFCKPTIQLWQRIFLKKAV